MDKTKRNLLLELVVFSCALIVVIVSASAMVGTQNKAQVIGLIAGSFGAGAILVNAIRDHAVQRRRG